MLAATGQAVLGVVGVFVFFIVSGYLVTASWENTRQLGPFLAKRGLRILPGLWACTVFCVFVWGPLFTTLTPGAYFRDPGTARYFWHNLVMEVSAHNLPGVSFSRFPDGGNIDGPLWSLPFEALMYLTVASLGALGGLGVWSAGALLALGIAGSWAGWGGATGWLHGYLWLVGFFAAGMLVRKTEGAWLHDRRLALTALAGLVLSAWLGVLNPLFPIFGGFLILHLALDPRLPPLPAARWGDLSYGLYIYGWPVEQGVMRLMTRAPGHEPPWWLVFILAWPAAAALAFASWHGIERPALALKPRGRPALSARPLDAARTS